MKGRHKNIGKKNRKQTQTKPSDLHKAKYNANVIKTIQLVMGQNLNVGNYFRILG